MLRRVRRAGLRRSTVLLLAGSVLVATTAHAQAVPDSSGEPAEVLLLTGEGDGARASSWERDVGRALTRAGVRVSSDPLAWVRVAGARYGTVDPPRLAALTEVAALLAEARAESARLREGPALGRLARAAQLVEAHADMPGSAAWAAEVWTATGVIAAQAGLAQLADVALARAATLDPRRGVRAAEASPDVVARAAEIARAVASGPTGSFEVIATVTGTRVLVDDGDVGAAPQIVRLSVGRHIVRLEAPGYRPFGQSVDVLEGERPAMTVRLAPDPALVAADALATAGRRGDAPAVAEALAAIGRAGFTPPRVVLVEAGRGPRDRARLRDCRATGCEPAVGLDRDALPTRFADARGLGGGGSERRPDDSWLSAPEDIVTPPPGTPWYARWYVWTIAGAVIAGAVTTGVLAQEPPATTQRTELRPRWGDGT